MDRDKRHVEFPPLQTHSRMFELVLIGLSLVCIVVVLVILLFTNLGTEFRPTA